jgi:hypothetical protein
VAVKPSPNPKNNMWDLIAYYLRVYRKVVGSDAPATARVMKVSEATLSRTEQGARRLPGSEAALLDKAWSTGGIFVLLVYYASIGHDPQWFAQYLHLEAGANVINTFQAQTIPGLLQTEDYARALFSAGDPAQVDRLLGERIQRQLVLERVPAPHLSVVVSQNALEWPVGSPEIMRAQLAHLLKLSEFANVVIRVVPRSWDVGAYVGLDGSFTRMSGEDFGEVAYTESPEGGRLVSSPQEVTAFTVRYNRVSAKALPDGASRSLIETIMEDVS